MRSNLIVGLDIGTTKTCAVIAETSGDPRRPALKILGVGQARTNGVSGDRVTHIEETTESIRQAVRESELMAGAPVNRLFVGISGDHVEARASMGVVAVGDDEIAPGDVQRVHEVACAVPMAPDREMLHAIPTEYIVDGQRGIKDPIGMSGTRLEAEVYLVSCSQTAAANIRKAVSRAGFGVHALVLEPLASSLSVLTADEREIGVAMVEIGAGSTDLAVYYDGKIRHVAVLPVGGQAVTSDLVRGLAIPFAEAQRAKEQHALAFSQMADPAETVELPGPGPNQRRHVAKELIAHIAEQRLDELFGLVNEQLMLSGMQDRLGAGIVITGGTAALPGLPQLAEQIFAAPVRLGVPGEGLTGLADSVGRPRFATAAGLALYGAERFAETGQGASTYASGFFAKLGAWLKEFF